MKKNNRTVYIYTCGGLGNQLFQYAAGFALARHIGASMLIDTHSGFASDREFGRKFALSGFLNGKSIKACSVFARARYRLFSVLAKLTNLLKISPLNSHSVAPLIVTNLGFLLLFRESFPVYTELFPLIKKSSIALHGYWQSHYYFEPYKEALYKQIIQGLQFSESAKQLAEKLQSAPTLALGLRLYEETLFPELNAHERKLKSIEEIARELDEFLTDHQNVQVAVFCTHRSRLFSKLNLPSNTLYLTADDGFTSAADTLLLMMNCQHHLFLNSSLYWWGAWLSGMNPIFNNRPQVITAANNFINQSCYVDGWRTF